MTTTTISTPRRTSTTDMQVTSIRLESELKDKLRDLAGNMGYQTLIREILWKYVQQHAELPHRQLTPADIRATLIAIAQRSEHCAITGQPIHPQQQMWLGLTLTGELVPLSSEQFS